MPDIPSNLIWIIGLVLLVLALAFLWNSKLSTHAAQSLSLEKEGEHPANERESERPRYAGMPVLTPALPPTQPAELSLEAVEDFVEPEVESIALSSATIEDCDDAERMLNIAWQLEVLGDFEGRDDYAKIVLEKKDVSQRQRDRAQAMLRRKSIS